MSNEEAAPSFGEMLLGPVKDLWYAAVPRGVPSGFTSIRPADWQSANDMLNGLPEAQLAAILEELRRDLAWIAHDRDMLEVPERLLRWSATALLAHEIARGGGEALARGRVGEHDEARVQTILSELDDAGALRAHPRLVLDMGPFADVFALGPYVLRLFGPALRILDPLARVPWLGLFVGLVTGAMWGAFAYADWLYCGVFLLGYLLIDRLCGPSTRLLRCYERAWGRTLFGSALDARRTLRDAWACGRDQAVSERVLGYTLAQVVQLDVATAPRPRTTESGGSFAPTAFELGRLAGGGAFVFTVPFLMALLLAPGAHTLGGRSPREWTSPTPGVGAFGSQRGSERAAQPPTVSNAPAARSRFAGTSAPSRCPLSRWDGAVRGWAKLGSPQCRMPGAQTGLYLRVAFNQERDASQAAISDAWRKYVETQLGGGACPSATELMFFDPSGSVGAGIFFPQKPRGWDALVAAEPQWRLLDSRDAPLTTPVCFFPADESRRPPSWEYAAPVSEASEDVPPSPVAPGAEAVVAADAPSEGAWQPRPSARPPVPCTSFETCNAGCEAGAMISCAGAAEILRTGTRGATKDEARAYQLYERACDGGEAGGCVGQGWLELSGSGTPKSAEKALASFEKTCSDALTTGCFGVGVVLRGGFSVPKDVGRAMAGFQKACDAGMAVACKNRAELAAGK